MTEQKRGIADLIATADSEAEITQLLAKGSQFTGANQRTRNRWHNLAKRRKAELKGAK